MATAEPTDAELQALNKQVHQTDVKLSQGAMDDFRRIRKQCKEHTGPFGFYGDVVSGTVVNMLQASDVCSVNLFFLSSGRMYFIPIRKKTT